MNRIKQNTERVYNYLKELGCNGEDINKIANELIILTSDLSGNASKEQKGSKTK
jgi:hypothetical protein